MKLSPKTIVFVAPSKIRKDFFDVLINDVPKIAACPDPSPGRKEVSGAANIDANSGGKNSFLVIDGFLTICFEIVVFDFMLMIMEEAPNNPESNGRKGSFTLELRTAIPRNPDRKKTIKAMVLSFSFDIKNMVEAISR